MGASCSQPNKPKKLAMRLPEDTLEIVGEGKKGQRRNNP
ncbi:MAG: hypothetical protein QOE55_3655 [Acidobacteriaceae bacterium]|jgi:hypothetical protein|nr:hypothetical protein [Acidobacteriaceae bacterium]